jgi:uncharacterized protein YegP (UPF0339 family)
MKLEIHQDNSARYRWTLAADDGLGLASSSVTFASYETALRAAEDVRDHGDSITVEERAGEPESVLATEA